MSIFNPFNEVFTQMSRPHAHLLRTSLRKKLADTFYIFTGKFGALTQFQLTGIFDYLTFFLTPGHMILSQIQPKKSIHRFVLGLSYLLQTALLPLRYLFGAVLTAISSPLVALTHLFSRIKAHKLISQSKTLTSTINETLAQRLSSDKATLEDYYCQFAILSKPKGEPVLVLSKLNDSENKKFIVELQNINEAQKSAVRALIELNFGGITQSLTERGLMHYFMKQLDKNFDQPFASYAEDKAIFHLAHTTATSPQQFIRDLVCSVDSLAPFKVEILEDYFSDASVRAFTKKMKKAALSTLIEDLKKIARGEINVYDLGKAYADQNTPESRQQAEFFLSTVGEYHDAYQSALLLRATIALNEKDFEKATIMMDQLPYRTTNAARHLATAIKICKRYSNLTPSELPNTEKSTPEESTREFFKTELDALIHRLQQEKHPLWHAGRKAKKITALQTLSSKIQQNFSPRDAIQALKSSTNYDRDIEAGRNSRVADLFNTYTLGR